MKRSFQSFFLGLYRIALTAGFLSTPLGKVAFELAYQNYKRYFEVGHTNAIRAFVKPSTTVIDVGAFIGFFAVQFARWVGPAGRVIALEPEPHNFATLQRTIYRNRVEDRVELIMAAVAESSGVLNFHIDPFHPAGHHISEYGTPMRTSTLDELLEQRNWPTISLIKLDVEGAEDRVLRGATETLARFHPALFVEINDLALRRMNSSSEHLLSALNHRGYDAHRLEDGRISRNLSSQEVLSLCKLKDYLDFLFISRRLQ